jgi:hypothetical protein
MDCLVSISFNFLTRAGNREIRAGFPKLSSNLPGVGNVGPCTLYVGKVHIQCAFLSLRMRRVNMGNICNNLLRHSNQLLHNHSSRAAAVTLQGIGVVFSSKPKKKRKCRADSVQRKKNRNVEFFTLSQPP